MSYEPTIQYAEGIADLTLNGTVKKGDTLAHNGTGWVQADASDAATNLYAQYVAMQGGVSGEKIKGCRRCVLYDADAPFTGGYGYKIYQSATAGAITTTRPTTAADVIQQVGVALSTSEAQIDIKPPHEVEVWLQPNTYDTTGEAGLGIIDAGWPGPGLDGANEDAYFVGRFPSGVLSVDLCRVVMNGNAPSGTTISGTVIAVADGAANTGDTGTAFSAAAPTGLADNKLCYSDMTAMFDADCLKAGYNFVVQVTLAAVTSGELNPVGMLMRYTCV